MAVISAGAGMWSFALLWRTSMRLVNEERSRRDVSAWFFAGELAKYLPGGMWGVAGRSELAHAAGMRRSKAYTSTLLSLGLMVLGGAMAVLLLAPWAVERAAPLVRLSATAGGVLVLVLVAHPKVTSALVGGARGVTRGRVSLSPQSWRRALRAALSALIPWAWAGLSTVAMMMALGFSGRPLLVGLAAIAGWVIGVLAVPVPAGAGIREASFMVLSGMEPGQAAALALLMRTLLILIDAAGGIVAVPLLRRQRSTLRITKVERS